jgi:tetratricopeptide (TPR) repeat protein
MRLKFAGFAAAVLLSQQAFCSLSVGQSMDYPMELQVAVEEANEAFFDGKYEESLRLSERALKFFKDTEVQKLLVARQVDWQLHANFVLGLQAEALVAEGRYSAASAKLKSAMQKLRSRRGYYTKNRADQKFLRYLWLNDAFLDFIEGDLHRPCLRLPTSPTADMPVRDWEGDLCNPKKSESCYAKAVQSLDRIRLNPQPAQPILDGFEMVCMRSKLRAYVSLAKTELASPTSPTPEDINDAISYLVRAMDLHTSNGWWRLFGAPNALFPIGYHQLQKLSEEKALMNSGGAASLTEREIILVKQRFMHAICDWLMIMFTRAEADAYRELLGVTQTSQTAGWEMASAERYYQRAMHLLRAHFRGEHPMLGRAEFSKAAWLAIRSAPESRVGEMTELQVLGIASMARDVVFLANKMRLDAGGGDAPLKVQANCNFLELKGLRNLLGIHAKRPILSPLQIEEIKKRTSILEAELESLAQEIIRGGAANPGEDGEDESVAESGDGAS